MNEIPASLKKYLNSDTTLLTLLALMDLSVSYPDEQGFSTSQISEIYKHLHPVAGKKKFYPSYLQRHTRDRGLFREEAGLYSLNTDYLGDDILKHYSEIRSAITGKLDQGSLKTEQLISEIEQLCIAPPATEKLLEYIIKLLRDEALLPNYGQLFEVAAYAILKVYFRRFNFELKRFSTSFANDGGMDYIAEQGIYQVTTAATRSKLNSDLEKLPGVDRVMVVTRFPESAEELLADENIREIIALDDLAGHFLPWLALRKERGHSALVSVLMVFLEELRRDLE